MTIISRRARSDHLQSFPANTRWFYLHSAASLGAPQLVERLFADQDTAAGVPTEFLKDIALRFKDDGLDNIIQPLVSGIAARARAAGILTDWRNPIKALLLLIDVPAIAAVIPHVATWNPPNATARQLEIVSALGPFFKTSGFCADDVRVLSLTFLVFKLIVT